MAQYLIILKTVVANTGLLLYIGIKQDFLRLNVGTNSFQF